jgi:hypothetical protein
MKSLVLVAMLIFGQALCGQDAIPVGTILPVQLNSSVRSDKAKPGQVITARLMQDLPLSGRLQVRSGAKVVGRVVAVRPAGFTGPAEVVLRFDTIKVGRRRIAVTTNLRALANMMAVNEAQVPETGPDRGTTEFDWNTEQIGGEADFHGSVITNGAQTVGKSVPPNGALVHIDSVRGTKCRANLDNNDRLQATWVFASDACGLYGYPNLMLTHAGRTDPRGQFVLQSDKGKVNIQAGSGMLLRVD